VDVSAHRARKELGLFGVSEKNGSPLGLDGLDRGGEDLIHEPARLVVRGYFVRDRVDGLQKIARLALIRRELRAGVEIEHRFLDDVFLLVGGIGTRADFEEEGRLPDLKAIAVSELSAGSWLPVMEGSVGAFQIPPSVGAAFANDLQVVTRSGGIIHHQITIIRTPY